MRPLAAGLDAVTRASLLAKVGTWSEKLLVADVLALVVSFLIASLTMSLVMVGVVVVLFRMRAMRAKRGRGRSRSRCCRHNRRGSGAAGIRIGEVRFTETHATVVVASLGRGLSRVEPRRLCASSR